ncbi:MAG: hypothetical protein KJ645_14640, partial [Planctomycetes bacterium]|nr:hypothetical protein [Planctomycetota bacterium]
AIDLQAGSDDPEPIALLGSCDHDYASPVLPDDGNRIFFVHWPGNSYCFKREIWMAELGDSGMSVGKREWLTCDLNDDSYLDVSSSGDMVYWVSHRIRDGLHINRIYKMILSTGEKTVLFDTTGTPDYTVDRISVSTSGYIAFPVKFKNQVIAIRIIDLMGHSIHEFTIKDIDSSWEGYRFGYCRFLK